MSSSRTSRLSAAAAAVFACAAAVAVLCGCYDEFHPTRAEVKVRFLAEPASLARGARFSLDGRTVIGSTSHPEWDSILAAGRHTFAVHRDCADVAPSESVAVTIEGGRPLTIDFRFVLRCGLLTVNFHPDVSGLEVGTKVWLDDNLIVQSLDTPSIEMYLEPGDHTLRFAAADSCTTLDPGEVPIHIAGAEQMSTDVDVHATAGVLTIESDPSGLPIRLDDQPHGMTPATIRCIEGTHQVVVSPGGSPLGFAVLGDTAKTVTIPPSGTADASFVFIREPRPQARGVILELFTATLCQNCPPADAAVDQLEHDPEFSSEAFSGIEMHVSWGGSDPFYTDDVDRNRMALYNDAWNSAPIAFVNGTDRVIGSGAGIYDTYRSKVLNTYGQDGEAALYWTNVAIEGLNLRGELRFVAVSDLSAYAKPKLYAFYAKDSLRANPDPYHVGYYNGVARRFLSPVDLRNEGALAEGSFVDVPVSFDLSADAAFPAHSLKLVAFVQDSTTKSIIQVREARIRLP